MLEIAQEQFRNIYHDCFGLFVVWQVILLLKCAPEHNVCYVCQIGWILYTLIVFNCKVTNAESDLQKKKELLKESEGSEVLKGDEVSSSTW